MTTYNLEGRLDKLAASSVVNGIKEDEIYDTLFNAMHRRMSYEEIEEVHPYFYHRVLHYRGME
tara:strand:- start:90 stop:278 length:189 start_codon:yes stop_codon:yes gene_type:complete